MPGGALPFQPRRRSYSWRKAWAYSHIGRGIDIGGPTLLAGLPPLAGEEQHRGSGAVQHRLADGLAPVGDDPDGTALLLPRWGDLPADVRVSSSPLSSSVR